MDYRFRIGQEDLKFLYDTAQSRMEANPDVADKQKEIIEKFPYFTTEKDVVEKTLRLIRKDDFDYQIWAKIERDGDFYRLQGWWIVTDNWKIKQAADYIGMALMYDTPRLRRLIYDNVKLDDIIAY